MDNPVNLHKLDTRLLALLDMLKQQRPYGEVASKIDQFISDHEHGEFGPQSLFRPGCRDYWKRGGDFPGCDPFANAWIYSIGKLDDRLKDVLTQVCVEALRFLLDSDKDFHRQKHTVLLKDALSEYLAIREYEVGSPAKTEQGEGNGGAGSAPKKGRSTKPSDSPPKLGRPVDPMTIQRANFAKPLRDEDMTWEEIADRYKKSTTQTWTLRPIRYGMPSNASTPNRNKYAEPK